MFILQQCNKCNTLKKTPSPGKPLITTYSMFFGWYGPERWWGGSGRLFEFEFEWEGGRVGVGAYSNKCIICLEIKFYATI